MYTRNRDLEHHESRCSTWSFSLSVDKTDDFGQMTGCVASSISRWHGCKAEYYLLSCSTHSDLSWRDDRRRGPGVYFSRQPLSSCCRRLKIRAKGSELRQEQDVNLFQCRRTILWTRGHKLVQQILLQIRRSNDMFFSVCTALSLNFYGILLLTTTCMSYLPQILYSNAGKSCGEGTAS